MTVKIRFKRTDSGRNLGKVHRENNNMARLRIILVMFALLGFSFGTGCTGQPLKSLAKIESQLESPPFSNALLTDLENYVKHRDPFVRAQAIIVIANTAKRYPNELSSYALPVFIECLKDKDVAPRREAAIGLKSLGAYSAPKAKEIADELLKNPDSDIAYFLAKTIENIPDQSRITLPILIKYTNRYPPKAGSFPDFNQDVYKTFLYIRDYANTNNRINKGSVPIIDEAL